MLDEIDSHELAEWQAYYKLEPFGEERADYRNAILAYTVAKLWSKDAPDLEDFMPFLEKQAQTFEEMKSVVARAKQRTEVTRG